MNQLLIVRFKINEQICPILQFLLHTAPMNCTLSMTISDYGCLLRGPRMNSTTMIVVITVISVGVYKWHDF
jgi:hypothetical protein